MEDNINEVEKEIIEVKNQLKTVVDGYIAGADKAVVDRISKAANLVRRKKVRNMDMSKWHGYSHRFVKRRLCITDQIGEKSLI